MRISSYGCIVEPIFFLNCYRRDAQQIAIIHKYVYVDVCMCARCTVLLIAALFWMDNIFVNKWEIIKLKKIIEEFNLYSNKIDLPGSVNKSNSICLILIWNVIIFKYEKLLRCDLQSAHQLHHHPFFNCSFNFLILFRPRSNDICSSFREKIVYFVTKLRNLYI